MLQELKLKILKLSKQYIKDKKCTKCNNDRCRIRIQRLYNFLEWLFKCEDGRLNFKNILERIIRRTNILYTRQQLTLDDVKHLEERIIDENENEIGPAKTEIVEISQTSVIIESENIKASKKSIEFIQTLKEIGIQIFIDDFGSGFANFDYLFALGADGIKIDGNLVKNVLVDKRNEVIIKTIVEFAKQFNMKVIAGYVENESIFDKLKELGVECFQGYFYSKPREDIIT